MGKIVLDLQQDALKKERDISDLLRKAYLVARKLKLKGFEEWINNELKGYSDKLEIPNYRKVRGEIKGWNPYHGWQSVLMSDKEIDDATSSCSLSDSIPSLSNIYDNSPEGCIIQLGAHANNMLSKRCNFNTKFAVHIDGSRIYNILEKVRNIILDWSITLEEGGILGEDLQFSEKEKEIASNTSTINHYTNNFYGKVNDTQIQQSTKDSIQE